MSWIRGEAAPLPPPRFPLPLNLKKKEKKSNQEAFKLCLGLQLWP